MRTIIGIFFLIVAVHLRAEPVFSLTLSSYAEGKRFDFEVTREQLLKTTAWKAEDDFPPLSPRKAEKLATIKFGKLIKNTKGWERERISLQTIGDNERWFYVVEFSHHGSDGPPPYFKIIVLMDGTVIEPKVSVPDRQ
jgi:hypothetical protein